ncbi:MAG: FkbM family methyltransferase [Pseudomonadota bacterium]
MALPNKLRPGYLRRYGFQAQTIIDVGVLDGTPFLYDAFPDRRFILIDPLEESRAAVARRWAHLDYDFHLCALGATPGQMALETDPARLTRTSGARRISGDGALLERRRIPVRPLDAIVAGLSGPFGLKIDTEGHELDVLRGAERTLAQCEFVIAEVSIKKRFRQGYRFSDVIEFMASRGFQVYSFLSGLTRAPRMADILFVPADSSRFDMTAGDT